MNIGLSRRGKLLLVPLLAGMALMFAACVSESVSREASRTVWLSARSIRFPADLADGELVARIACEADEDCPEIEGWPLTCAESRLCTLGQAELSSPIGGAIDGGALAMREVPVFGAVDAVYIDRFDYAVISNDLNFEVAEVDIFWVPWAEDSTPEDTDLDRDGNLLGTFPVPEAGELGDGSLDIIADSVSDLASYFLDEYGVARLFARTSIDIAPGAELPAGEVEFRVDLTVTAVLNFF